MHGEMACVQAMCLRTVKEREQRGGLYVLRRALCCKQS